MPTEEELERLRKASEASAAKARELLDEDVKTVMAKIARINELKPNTVDEKTYNDLIKVVKDATEKNHSIATLKENIKKLGDGAVSLFKEIANIAKDLS